MKDLLADLNDAQRAAVTAPLGPVLVLAGAGSGKTRALTARIAYLIAKKLFAPEEILALTFTNKAAGEMKERVQKLIANSYQLKAMPTMGTFHSVCVRILRQDIEKLTPLKPGGYSRNFTIYDSEDSKQLVKQIVLELGLSENFRPQVFSYYISAAKNKLLSPGELNLENPYLEEALEKVWKNYQDSLRQNNALDFDDLLGLAYELFRRAPAALEKYRQKFKYVLVDEYQDTNHAQYMLLQLLAQKHKNLFVVGDDAQSIYGFRGANMQNILDFKKDYPKAAVVMLEQNYRSTRPILDVANEVIKLNAFQYEKNLWTDRDEGPRVNLYEAADEMDEARFVVRTIVSSRHSEGNPEESHVNSKRFFGVPQNDSIIGNDNGLVYVPEETPILNKFMNSRFRFSAIRPLSSEIRVPENLSEYVVLYRTHAQSRPIEEILVASGVPYQIVGGIKFYERREIKDALSFLRLVANPRDLVSLERVINLPARGIGRAAFKEIARGLHKYDYNFERLHLNLDQLELTDKAAAGAKEFFSLYSDPNLRMTSELSEYSEHSDADSDYSDRSVLDLLDLLLKRSGYKQALLKEGSEGLERWENVEELFNVAGKFSGQPYTSGLTAMLEEIALMSDLDKTSENENKLTLMTLHSAKGLEWDSVYFVGLEEGLLPHSRSFSTPEEMAEEIRLAYVGITRARQHLYLSYARARQTYGETKKSMPSRILKAIPEKMINKIVPTNY